MFQLHLHAGGQLITHSILPSSIGLVSTVLSGQALLTRVYKPADHNRRSQSLALRGDAANEAPSQGHFGTASERIAPLNPIVNCFLTIYCSILIKQNNYNSILDYSAPVGMVIITPSCTAVIILFTIDSQILINSWKDGTNHSILSCSKPSDRISNTSNSGKGRMVLITPSFPAVNL